MSFAKFLESHRQKDEDGHAETDVAYALRLGLPVTTLNHLLHMKDPDPRRKTREKIAKGLGLPLADIREALDDVEE